jgi:hypothetical protein
MHPASVSRIVHDPLFQQALHDVRKRTDKSMLELRVELADIGVDALASLSRLLKDEKVSTRVRFRIAKLVLDAAGLREE